MGDAASRLVLVAQSSGGLTLDSLFVIFLDAEMKKKTIFLADVFWISTILLFFIVASRGDKQIIADNLYCSSQYGKMKSCQNLWRSVSAKRLDD